MAIQYQEPFKVAQPTTSKHLKVLEKAGLVKRKIEGQHHRFHLDTSPIEEAQDWIERYKVFWEATMGRLNDALNQIENTGNE